MTRTFWPRRLRTGVSLVAGLALIAGSASATFAASHKAAGKIKYGGSVFIQSNDTGPSPRNFNPFSGSAQLGTIGDIYETLLMYNTIAGGPPKPWLATSYKWSNGDKLLTFQIRKGVKWQDGKPFTAADVAYTYNLILKNPVLDGIGLSSFVSSVQETGPYTVVFHFKTADVPELYYIAGVPIVPEHIWAKVKNPTKWLDPNPVGTGPFKLASFSTSNYVFDRNPNYWQPGKPYVSQLVFKAFTFQAVELALSKGQITWSDAYSPTLKKTYVAWDPGANKYWFPAEGEVALFPNDQKAPFNNMFVRQALSYAVNRQVIDNVGETTFEPPANGTGIILPNQKAWLDSQVAHNYNYHFDPAMALKLFAKAGYHLNAQHQLVNKAGQQLTFTMNVPAGWPDWILDEQIMVNELKQLGINASTQQLAFGTFYQNLSKGAFQLDMWFTGFGPTPYFNYDPVLNGIYYAPNGQAASNDFERWNQPATTKLLHEFTSTSNPAREHAILDQIQGVMAKYQPVIPLVYAADWDEYRTNQFVGWPTPQNPYANPSPSDQPWNEPVVLNIHLK